MDLSAPDSRGPRYGQSGSVALRWRHGLRTVPYPQSAVHRTGRSHRIRRTRPYGGTICNKWGCQVHAFTTSDSKEAEARKLGAHYVHNTKQDGALKKIAGTLDFIISTVNAGLDVPGLLDTLAPKGRLHNVGAVLTPLQVPAFSLILGQKSVSGSPTGSPAAIDDMLEFSARHSIAPITEIFPMSKVNDAFERLRSGKARYRLVLENEKRGSDGSPQFARFRG